MMFEKIHLDKPNNALCFVNTSHTVPPLVKTELYSFLYSDISTFLKRGNKRHVYKSKIQVTLTLSHNNPFTQIKCHESSASTFYPFRLLVLHTLNKRCNKAKPKSPLDPLLSSQEPQWSFVLGLSKYQKHAVFANHRHRI